MTAQAPLSVAPFLQTPACPSEAPGAVLPFSLNYSRYVQRLAQARAGWAERVQAAAAGPISVAWLSARFGELFEA
ncbi:hypothetical protein, partial [Ralstonia pseudosolanacearum]